MNINYYIAEDQIGTAQLNSTYPTFATDFLKTVDNITIEAFLDDSANCPQTSSDGNTGLVYLGPAEEKEGYIFQC